MALGPGISRRLFTGPACFSSASVASRAGSSGTVELCSARRCSRTRVLVSLCSDLRLIRSRAFRRAIAEVAKEENIEQSTEKKKKKKRNDVSKLQQRNSRTFFNTGTQTQEGKFSRVGVSKQMPRESEILVLYPSLCNNSPPGLLKKKKKSTREYERLVMTSLRVTCKL